MPGKTATPCECGHDDHGSSLELRSFSVQEHCIGAACTIVRGEQRTAEWHQNRQFSIGASNAHETSAHRMTSASINKARLCCGLDQPSIGGAAAKHGIVHEHLGLYQLLNNLQGPGINVEVAEMNDHGLIKSSTGNVHYHYPNAFIDTDIQLIRAKVAEYLHWSPDGIICLDTIGADKTASDYIMVELKCPYSADNRALTALQLLQSKKEYVTQIQQAAAILALAQHPNISAQQPNFWFVRWSPPQDISVVEIRPSVEAYMNNVLPKLAHQYAHYIHPVKLFVQQHQLLGHTKEQVHEALTQRGVIKTTSKCNKCISYRSSMLDCRSSHAVGCWVLWWDCAC